MALWLNLKRNKHFAEIYYKGQKICTIKVDEQNRGSTSIISLDGTKDVQFRVVKENVGNVTSENDSEIENKWNREIYNR